MKRPPYITFEENAILIEIMEYQWCEEWINAIILKMTALQFVTYEGPSKTLEIHLHLLGTKLGSINALWNKFDTK